MTEKPAATKDTIYIDADDEITTVIDKVENAKHKVVALVLPKRSSVFQSIVNMRLLARSAEKASKDVVLITSEASVLPLAGAAGLHVAHNLHSRPQIPPSPVYKEELKSKIDEDEAAIGSKDAKLDYHRSIGELAAGASLEEPDSIDLEDEDGTQEKGKKHKEKVPKDKKLSVPNFNKFRLRLLGGIGGLVLLVVFLVLGLVVWPKAKITLRTESLPLAAQFNLKTSDSAKNYDDATGTIPVALKTKDQTTTQSVQATGQKNLGNKASGSASMSAQDCSPPFSTPAEVPAGTGVATNGLTYITQSATSFSITGAAGSCVSYSATAATAITAQSGGAKYNVSSATFSVNGRPDVSATGSASGGTDNNITVVSQSDVDGAKQKIGNTGTDSAAVDFVKSLEESGLYVVSSTLKATEPTVTASPDVGQQASNSTVTVKVTYSVLTMSRDELKKAISTQLDKKIDKNKQKPSSEDVIKDAKISVLEQSSPTVATLRVELNTTAIPIIDVADAQRTAAGKKSGEITSLLSNYPGVKSVDVRFSPFWVSKAPKKTSKIIIIQEQVKTNP